jgi:hypothetical protein
MLSATGVWFCLDAHNIPNVNVAIAISNKQQYCSSEFYFSLVINHVIHLRNSYSHTSPTSYLKNHLFNMQHSITLKQYFLPSEHKFVPIYMYSGVS